MYTVSDQDHGKRLDQYVSEQLGISRTQAKKMIDLGGVLYNSAVLQKPSERVKLGATVQIEKIQTAAPVKETETQTLSDFPIQIITETEEYLVVSKPAGLLVHPSLAEDTVSLVHWLKERYPEIENVGEGSWRAGIVHRLDRLASGALVVAKTAAMHAHLKAQFQARTVEKEYIVLVHGNMEGDTGVIDFPIDRGAGGKMVARPKQKPLTLKNVSALQPGKVAKTEFTVMQTYNHHTLLNVRIHSGRTHQIRVHMYALDHPVVGDTLYIQRRWVSKNALQLDRLFLHASHLGFDDLQGNRVNADAQLPLELENFLALLT